MMTTRELKEKVYVTLASGYDNYSVCIQFRGNSYVCKSNNGMAWYRLKSVGLADSVVLYGYTLRQALQAFYDECRVKNKLL